MKVKCILLIDDDEVTNYINTRIFKLVSPEIKITVALNGREGLTLIQERIRNEDPMFDVILVDISMPEMDGWQFIETLSSESYSMYHRSNVVMLTSSVFGDDITRAARFSLVKSFLSKPLDVAKVNQILNYAQTEHEHLPN